VSAAGAFDGEHYKALNSSRAPVISEVVSEVRKQFELRTAVDVGCGAGYFSALLNSLGFEVIAVDGRRENAEEGKRRVPQVTFHVLNAEDSGIRNLGCFDLVFCFGLLYHLENPFQAIRHLHAMTSKILLVESVCFPGKEPIMALVDEESNDAQGLNHIAFYPTEECLIKMFYRAGFTKVYRLTKPPNHPDFQAKNSVSRVRTILAASHAPLDSNLLELVAEPSTPVKPWDATSVAEHQSFGQKLRRFINKPLSEKAGTLRNFVMRRTTMRRLRRQTK
jgi:SAM-dependent methyltransferase